MVKIQTLAGGGQRETLGEGETVTVAYYNMLEKNLSNENHLIKVVTEHEGHFLCHVDTLRAALGIDN